MKMAVIGEGSGYNKFLFYLGNPTVMGCGTDHRHIAEIAKACAPQPVAA